LVANATRLSMSCFLPEIEAVKVAVELRSRRQKMVFGPPTCRGREYLRFRTCVFKSHLLSSMWPVFVEFRSASSEGRGRKNKQKKNSRRIAVKPKSADKYVGWPTSTFCHRQMMPDVESVDQRLCELEQLATTRFLSSYHIISYHKHLLWHQSTGADRRLT